MDPRIKVRHIGHCCRCSQQLWHNETSTWDHYDGACGGHADDTQTPEKQLIVGWKQADLFLA